MQAEQGVLKCGPKPHGAHRFGRVVRGLRRLPAVMGAMVGLVGFMRMAVVGYVRETGWVE